MQKIFKNKSIIEESLYISYNNSNMFNFFNFTGYILILCHSGNPEKLFFWETFTQMVLSIVGMYSLFLHKRLHKIFAVFIRVRVRAVFLGLSLS